MDVNTHDSPDLNDPYPAMLLAIHHASPPKRRLSSYLDCSNKWCPCLFRCHGENHPVRREGDWGLVKNLKRHGPQSSIWLLRALAPCGLPETMSKICSNRQFFLPAHLIVTRIQHRDRSNPVGEVIPPFDDSVWETDAHLLVALFGERIFACVLVNAPVPVPHGVNMVAQTRT